MNKSKILQIIQKTNLNGRCNSVIFNIDEEQTLTVSYAPIEKQYLFFGNFEQFDVTSGKLGIRDTDSLTKILSALDDEIKINVTYEHSKPFALEIEDSAVDVKFFLTDTSLPIFTETPSQKSFPDQHIQFDLNKETMTRFIKAKNALSSDKMNFVILTDENKIDIILNYSQINTNQISMSVEGEVTKQITEPLAFSADIVKDIFAANMNCEQASFQASAAGLLTLQFSGPQWSTKYLVPKIQL